MKYYKDSQGMVYAYESDGSQDAFIKPGLIAITQAEADALRNPPPTLADAKAAQIAILTAAYNTAIQQPVAYMSTTFQADADSQTKVISVLAAMTPAGATPAGFYWVDAANTHIPMTLAQVQGLAQAMMAQGWAAFQQLQTRKASVNAATTIDVVQAVVW
jgi:hypothetical protein